MSQPRYSKEEFAARGDAVYEQRVRPHASAADEGKFVAIDIDTGTYEIDEDEIVATDRVLARYPSAQIWVTRIGSRCARRFGPRPTAASA
jgi:hypothetical protein